MKTLHRVVFTTEIFVMADNEGEAVHVAFDSLEDEVGNASEFDGHATEVNQVDDLGEWEGCMAYGDDENRTCREILTAQVKAR